MSKICKTCGQTLVKSRIPEVIGVWKIWRVRLLDYPVLTCSEGHEKREVYADFNVDWSLEFTEMKKLWTTPNGFFWKYFRCTHCGHLLEKTL